MISVVLHNNVGTAIRIHIIPRVYMFALVWIYYHINLTFFLKKNKFNLFSIVIIMSASFKTNSQQHKSE